MLWRQTVYVVRSDYMGYSILYGGILFGGGNGGKKWGKKKEVVITTTNLFTNLKSNTMKNTDAKVRVFPVSASIWRRKVQNVWSLLIYVKRERRESRIFVAQKSGARDFTFAPLGGIIDSMAYIDAHIIEQSQRGSREAFCRLVE